MALHLRQHFVDLGDLPGMLRRPSIAQQRVGFVEDEKGAKIGRLFERRGDRFFGLAKPHRAEIGEPLFQDVQIEALGEMTSVCRLSRSGRTRQAEGEGARARSCNLVGQLARSTSAELNAGSKSIGEGAL